MCGIAGWVDLGRPTDPSAGVINRMLDPLACRGPDAEGAWHGRHAVLGHRRLAIIDLEGGVQPMADTPAAPHVVLSYSGDADSPFSTTFSGSLSALEYHPGPSLA